MKQYVLKKNGLYYGKDNITKQMPTKLQEFVKINKGVTLRDIFKMMNMNKKFFSELFKEHYCKEYIKYGLNIKSCGTNYFDVLRIYLSATMDTGLSKDDIELNYIWYVDGIKDNQLYAIDLSHLSKIIDVPIIIGYGYFNDFVTGNKECKSVDSIKISGQPTLYDILNCLLNEISFHGLPSHQAKFNKNLDRILKDNGIEKDTDYVIICNK